MHIKKIESLTFTDEQTIENKMTFTQTEDFSTYNVIYGLNGSGKSSISRLFNSFSKQSRERDNNIDGSLILEDDNKLSTINKTNISHDNILVFNKDFIDDNLIFHKNNKNVKFSYINISADTIEIEKKLEALKKKSDTLIARKKNLTNKEKNVKNSIKDSIVLALNLGTSHSYNITKLNGEIDKQYSYSDLHKLSKEELDKKIEFLKNYKTEYFTIKELEKSQLISLVKNLHLKIKDLLQKPQLLEGSINRLSNDKTLNNLVSSLYKLMIEKPDIYLNNSCPFCETENINIKNKAEIPFQDFFTTLKNHFNEDYKNIETDFNSIKKDIDLINVDGYHNNEFLSNLSKYVFLEKDNNTKLHNEHKISIKSFYTNIESILKQFKEISKNKFNNIKSSDIKVDSYNETYIKIFNNLKNVIKNYEDTIIEVNKLVSKHNEDINNRNDKKIENENYIKNHYISIHYYKLDIYNKILSKHKILENSYDKEKNDLEEAKNKKINDFKNKYLSTLNDLLEDKININFSLDATSGHIYLKRNNVSFDINKLSEGEKNIILFSYFVSIINHEKLNNSNKLIVVIDDPHCSLDEYYLEKITLLIKNNIRKDNKKNNQLFIFSHNDDFLIELHDHCLKDTVCNYYELRKITNKIMINKTSNNWTTNISKYVNLYNKLLDFCSNYESFKTEQSANVPIRKFIERMHSYLYPKTKINITDFSKKLGIEEQTLTNILSHDNDKSEGIEAKNTYDVIKAILKLDGKDYYIKEHLNQLSKS